MRAEEVAEPGALSPGRDREGAADTRKWTAVVLAGSRAEADALAAHFELPLKALVPVAGAPMISHVAQTLARCPSIGAVTIVAQRPDLLQCAELRALERRFPIRWAAGKDGIAQSVMALAGTDAAPWPILVTTADHPLLTPDMVEHFLSRSQDSDLTLAVVSRDVLCARYPRSRRTWLRFRGGAYTGANLFALRTPKAANSLRAFAQAEANRKNQLKLLWHFGPAHALGAVTRTLTLQQVVQRVGKRFDMEQGVVLLPYAEAGIDVDSVEDWRFADSLIAGRSHTAPAHALPVSVFDLDRTLTRRGTYTAFLLYAAWRRAPWRLLLAPIAILAFLAYACRATSRKALKERLQALFLGRRTHRPEIARLARGFVARLDFHSDGLKAVEAERLAGRRIVLATAANAFYVEAIAEKLGIGDVVCTESIWDGNYLTARIDGENCHGREKLAMLLSYFRRAGLDPQALHVRFFSDHPSDGPLFRWANEAFVVNPSRRFRPRAAAAGWSVLSWA